MAETEQDKVATVTMRELGKLTAAQVKELDHPLVVTSNGLPIAWLVPLTASERRQAEMIASGRLKPARNPKGLAGWKPHPAIPGVPPLSEVLLEMRAQERT